MSMQGGAAGGAARTEVPPPPAPNGMPPDAGAADGKPPPAADVAPADSAAPPAPAAPQIVVDPTKDLWQNIALNTKENNLPQSEANLFVVGCSGAGKTSVIQRVCSAIGAGGNTSGKGKTKVKPTTALDYQYTTRSDRHVSQTVHFWELAQGMELSQLCEVVITPENVHLMHIAIVVDFSDPSSMWDTLAYWLKRVDRRANEILQKMRAKGSNTPDKLHARAQRALGEGHPDLKRVRLSGLPTVIVCNKVDAFPGPMEQMKTLTRCLRFIAHLYGAYLVFSSDADSAKLRLLLNHLLFLTPFDARQVELDVERGTILIMPENDTFVDIGDPPLCDGPSGGPVTQSTGDSELDRWKVPLDAMFPPKAGGGRAQSDAMLKRLYDMGEGGFGEPTIDTIRRQKDEELEQYRKSAARRDKGDK
ncbi:dynein light intermediate chain, putative [Trypanosoma brucei brucei TREU927]|uniref:Cytoplasmic dynein 2 light intermediate chain 1 n=2 Tax=Trypanosoma brucei TaxID=5691 RepID=Q381A5_TRYB2|nr:dynein light intermediate chain, putative [Trypanosoma brucei brucei TREU927]EAN80626.1 dynein light intermediate chain, putative [Trypanosoma brucei brucei TREU927]